MERQGVSAKRFQVKAPGSVIQDRNGSSSFQCAMCRIREGELDDARKEIAKLRTIKTSHQRPLEERMRNLLHNFEELKAKSAREVEARQKADKGRHDMAMFLKDRFKTVRLFVLYARAVLRAFANLRDNPHGGFCFVCQEEAPKHAPGCGIVLVLDDPGRTIIDSRPEPGDELLPIPAELSPEILKSIIEDPFHAADLQKERHEAPRRDD